MRAIDVSIVTYRPDLPLLGELLRSLAEPTRTPVSINLLVQDNSADPALSAEVERTVRGAFPEVSFERSATNVGFGRGHNANAARGAAPLFFVLNPDCILEPGTLDALVAAVEASADDVAAWEPRQIPYEHPKAYDPVTLEAPWVSGAACLLRRSAFDAVRGFEPRLFLYGEDVDLSWRLRAAGWKLTYQPRIGVVHRAYREAGEVKPQQVFGGVATNLCLRARYGGLATTLRGLALLAGEIGLPQSFPGRRRGLLGALARFIGAWPHFALTRVAPTRGFAPHFAGWSYEPRRDGAFVGMPSRREAQASGPLVSILVRTIDRPRVLREALATCANQTYRPLEVVVIEDGPERSRAVIEEFASRIPIRYRATGERVGRARAGNLALAEARGEWLNFLDDDDALFADHVEVLLAAALRAGVPGAYALAWETPARRHGHGERAFDEVFHHTAHRQPFDRITLWHHNYMPVQSVLFHRRLYERHGGFAEDMDQLEDWNLWTRYTLQDDFLLVEKTTSKYRVPADAGVAAARQARLDLAYADAIERQRAMRVRYSLPEITDMADTYVASQRVVRATESHLRRLVRSHSWLARLASYRPVALRVVRRIRGRA